MPDGTKLPEGIAERFAQLNLKMSSAVKGRRGPPSVNPVPVVGALEGIKEEEGKEGEGEEERGGGGEEKSLGGGGKLSAEPSASE